MSTADRKGSSGSAATTGGASALNAPEDELKAFENLAVYCIRHIGELAREGNCDPQSVAEALDKIDFALGQSFGDLHSN